MKYNICDIDTFDAVFFHVFAFLPFGGHAVVGSLQLKLNCRVAARLVHVSLWKVRSVKNLKSTLVTLGALMTCLEHWEIKGVRAGFSENHNLLTEALSLQTARCKGVKAACASGNARDQPFPLLQQLIHLQLYVGEPLSSWPWFTIQKVRAHSLSRTILLLLLL